MRIYFSAIFVIMLTVLLARIPLGTFNNASSLDSLGHFILPATGSPLALLLLNAKKILPVFKGGRFVFIAILLGTTLEVMWEIIEFFVDLIFNLNWQPSNRDTMTDILLGLCGSALGATIFITLYRKKS